MRSLYGLLSVIVLLVLTWYLFVRDFEFKVTFVAKTLPGDIIETIRIWNRAQSNSEILEVDSVFSLKQLLVKSNRTYIYNWRFNMLNDTTTNVMIQITEPANVLSNKLLVPFSTPSIELDARSVSAEFYNILREHLEITKVKIEGEFDLPTTFCACTTIETSQIDKANGMMKNFEWITSFISQFGLAAEGPPLLKLISWNNNLGELKYDFCFPVIKRDSLPKVEQITYKEIGPLKALKATYNGNYITSDRAWYYLIYYAKTHGYKIKGLPIEYFFNNPNLGSNAEEWRADIYLPIEN